MKKRTLIKIGISLAALILMTVPCVALVKNVSFLEKSDETLSPGWHSNDKYTFYIKEDGTKTIGSSIIDGKTYYFDEDGYLCEDVLTDTGKLTNGTVSGKPADYSESSREIFPEDILNQYTLNAYTKKLWEGNAVYHETICFVAQEDGTILSGSLLYVPDEVVTVRSYDLQTVYVKDKDYKIEGKQIILTQDSDIPVCPAEIYAPHYPAGTLKDVMVTTFDETRHLGIDTSISVKYSINVTYTHHDSWDGLKPQNQLQYLPKTAQKLRNQENLNIVYFGDSITVGWEASGLDDSVIVVENCEEYHATRYWAPFCASWAKMVSDGLTVKYNNSNIHHINRAASGSTTTWGKTNARMLVTPYKPDVVVLAFGMNQVSTDHDTMKTDLQKIMDEITAVCPDTEFVLTSCMIPNPHANAYKSQKLTEQEQAMMDIQEEGRYNVAVAPVYSMCMEMISHGKTYSDLSGNNWNHPNDFMHRIYAQTVLSVLGA